ncbi:hypothetical protein [Catenulispora pinisilvae]|uniref:hypothetical protein n=1 Tax=Catenulispora pinisilvae TaxID=2705253 RepID=UPI0018912CD3|nr:hypothetical protein [Catenulispora pinisilvae]
MTVDLYDNAQAWESEEDEATLNSETGDSVADAEYKEFRPLATLMDTFNALREQPASAHLSVADVGKTLDVNSLAELLWDETTDVALTNAVWAALVRQVRTGDPGWTVVAAGLAFPALYRSGLMLGRCFPDESRGFGDIEAEMIEGFLTALRTIDLDDPGIANIAGALATKAFNIARRARYRDAGELAVAAEESVPVAPTYPVGHPDLVLARAVRAGVITGEEAEYIGRTRLEERGLEDVAAELGLAKSTLHDRRTAAEARLVEALTKGWI